MADSEALDTPSVQPQAGSSRGSNGVPPPVFPLARINRIVKCDESVGILSKEATYAIAVATELFVKYFAQEGYTRARLDGRKTVQIKDMTRAIDENQDLMFLMEAIPKPMSLSKALEQRKRLADEGVFDPETLRDEAGDAAEEEEEEDAVEELDDAAGEEEGPEAPKSKGGRKSGASTNGKAAKGKKATAADTSARMDVDDDGED